MKKCDEISANAEYSSLRKEGEELSTIKNIEMKIHSDRLIKKWGMCNKKYDILHHCMTPILVRLTRHDQTMNTIIITMITIAAMIEV